MTGKNKLRFGVTDNQGKRAATWTIISPKSKSDIYLTCRELKGTIKTSLHQSGSWHFGFSKSATKEYFEQAETKYIEIWKRPQEIAHGVILALRIITPCSSVITPKNDLNKNIIWIPNCEPGFATEIAIIITSTNKIIKDWPGKNSMKTKLVGSIKLANSEIAWVVYLQCSLTKIKNLSEILVKLEDNADINELQSGLLRAIIFGQNDDNSRVLLDCAL